MNQQAREERIDAIATELETLEAQVEQLEADPDAATEGSPVRAQLGALGQQMVALRHERQSLGG